MRRYETIIITDPDLSEDQRLPLIQRLEELIPQQDGLLVAVDEWGTKRLAYKIKKKARGCYTRMDYCGTSALVDEMERFLRIDDRALKFMTVLTERDVDTERIRKEIEENATKAKTEKELEGQDGEVDEAEDEQDAAPDLPDDDNHEVETETSETEKSKQSEEIS